MGAKKLSYRKETVRLLHAIKSGYSLLHLSHSADRPTSIKSKA